MEPEAMPMVMPAHEEHRWLHRLLGIWNSTANMPSSPDCPTSGGTETVEKLGEIWVVTRGRHANAKGEVAEMAITLGYDPAKKKYVGTWIGSMMSQLWVYEGELSEDGQTLHLESDGPSFTGEGMDRYRDSITILDPDHWRLVGATRGENGEWTPLTQTDYVRTT